MNEKGEQKKALTGDPRVDSGWFSRQHETREAHEIVQQQNLKRQENKAQLLEINRIARQERTAMQQLALLDKRLGAGVGAKKERERLKKFIENHPDVKAAKMFARYP